MEPLWNEGTCIYKNGLGHMAKMAGMPIYGENLKHLLLQNQMANAFETLCSTLGTNAQKII